MAKKSKNKKKNGREKPQYATRRSIWYTLFHTGTMWGKSGREIPRKPAAWFFLPIIGLLGVFAFLQFVYLPTAEPDMAKILSLVSIASIAISILHVLIFICRLLERPRFEFYNERVVERSGLFETVDQEGVFIGIYTVKVEQGFAGKIFNYGTVTVDYPGYWNLHTDGIAKPHRLKRYLETRITSRGLHAIVTNSTPYESRRDYPG